jgi:hypothetical protein
MMIKMYFGKSAIGIVSEGDVGHSVGSSAPTRTELGTAEKKPEMNIFSKLPRVFRPVPVPCIACFASGLSPKESDILAFRH